MWAFFFFTVDVIHDSGLLQKLFQARPRYQKQRRHENNHKTNPPNWRGTSYFGRTVHTHARCPRRGERATLLQESSFCEHSFQSRECTDSSDGAGLKNFYFKMYSMDKQGERVALKTSEQVTVCVLSLKMSCVFNVERTRLRGRDCCLSVRKRDKERNSFWRAFCFIQLIFQWTGCKHI